VPDENIHRGNTKKILRCKIEIIFMKSGKMGYNQLSNLVENSIYYLEFRDSSIY